jgi:hypothetical protein
VTSRFPVATSTDALTLCEIENGTRVADGRAPVNCAVCTADTVACAGVITNPVHNNSNAVPAAVPTARRRDRPTDMLNPQQKKTCSKPHC